ncbi:hypothetical protein OEA41_005904 [Lepraria neglecta]|uniref:Fe2OG dioxygenase domain-containing protein n=1 Tax=Lepraria neglecta TaxID=209136 RepID=A0AAD9Z6Q1_9LECA|nr:hypothetical protein OEA41_005904 [Lepraria neglecta]
MSAAKTIAGDGEDVEPSVAQLETISFEALRSGNTAETAKLFDVCCRDGIFYLDMLGSEPNVLQTVEDIYELENKMFDLPEDELMLYDIDKLSLRKLNGFATLISLLRDGSRLSKDPRYKPIGRNHGELAGNKDGFQSYALPKDGIMKLGREADFKRPQVVDTYMPSLHRFARAISAAASAILLALSSNLMLQSNENLNNVHRTHLPSPDLVRLLKYHAQPPSESGSSHVPHTDLGSMTFLFTKQHGLQVIGSESQEWEYVQPRAGCATVNIGDSLSLLTNKLLRSCRHRVSALPGQAMNERYSFAYFLRAEDETLMRAVKSPLVSEGGRDEEEVFTSGEWMKMKYAMLRKDTWNQNDNWILTGA